MKTWFKQKLAEICKKMYFYPGEGLLAFFFNRRVPRSEAETEILPKVSQLDTVFNTKLPQYAITLH